MTDPILSTWQTHCKHTQTFISGISAQGLAAKFVKGRTAGSMLAHLHNNRLDWLQPAAPDLSQTLTKIPKNETEDQALLLSSLAASGPAIETLLSRSLDSGKVKAFGGSPTSFMAYLIAHEFYHFGEVGILLGETGIKLDNKAAYVIWEWK
jgi:uncharacterized damage-inducible protein DinB